MNYKILLLSAGALLADLVLGIYIRGVAPAILVILVFYLALKLEYWEVIPIALLCGFLFDISLLDASIFNSIFLLVIALAVKFTSYKFIDFSLPSIQVISVIFLLCAKMIIFYLLYDRSLNSIFVFQSLISITIIALAIILYLTWVRFYVREKK